MYKFQPIFRFCQITEIMLGVGWIVKRMVCNEKEIIVAFHSNCP